MHIFLAFVTLAGVAVSVANAQQGEKGNSIIPFPRVGRSGNSPGLIPFPRIGRDGGLREVKRQLIPFPRVGKRPVWHPFESAFYTEYEQDFPTGMEASAFGAQPSFQGDLTSEDGDMEKRGGNPASSNGGMWFGPRLGRKKRSVSDAETSSEHKDTLDMKPLLKMLHNSNWAIIVPVKERRNFTPRLGRRSSPEVVEARHQRAQPFSPRLGRSGELSSIGEDDDEAETRMHFQRRNMDRDTTPDPLYDRSGPPFSPRMGRGDPFSPRLGRGDPFSPRLGRSLPPQPQGSDDRK